jgi:TonB family protein
MIPKRPNQKSRPLLWTLLISVGLHIIFLALKWSATHLGTTPEENKPIEITQLPPQYRPPTPQAQRRPPSPVPKIKTKPEQEIAETEDNRNRELDPNAKFLSDHTQTAEKQMKARNIDDFRQKKGTGANRGEKAAMEKPVTGEENQQKPPSEITADGDKLADKKQDTGHGVKRDWKTLTLKDLSLGGDGDYSAATDDRLKGVDEGDRTVLSTREYKFFSYYFRIKELLRQYWKPNVERKLTYLWARGKSVSGEEMVTQLLILLDDKGIIQKISRLGSCGFAELDEAAIEAFQKAGPFPNPPKGMMDPDGFVRIRWDFILRAEAGPSINFRSAGNGT